MQKRQAKTIVADLVSSFRRDFDAIMLDRHGKEDQIIHDYIAPFLGALGWANTTSSGDYRHRELVLQGSIRRGQTYIEPDIVLRVPLGDKGRMRDVLFVEAKHPKHDLTKRLDYIRQAYVYAHSTTGRANDPSAWVKHALLTDFEEFRLFECVDSAPLKPGREKLLNKYVVPPFDLTYEDYIDRFDLLWETFSRDQVLAGSLDALPTITSAELRERRIAPDDQFLHDLERWRERVARSLWRHNRNTESFDDQLLTEATQLLLDRLIFVRSLADNAIEEDYLSQLVEQIDTQEGDGIALYDSCHRIFDKLNTLYNGSVFKRRGELDAVTIGNQTLAGILRELQPETSPYSFAAMDVEIIGSAYERFLGKQIQSDGETVSVVEMPQVVKGIGAYYTPRYIVDHIVDETVGRLLDACESPADVAALKVLDPACGSGSFLIGVYDRLLQWHVDFFTRDAQRLSTRGANARVSPRYSKLAEVRELDDSSFVVRLTAWAKKQILLNNIFGVDIDPQAVEVTRFSLSLKALRGAEATELHADRTLFDMTILPDLARNVVCGNSLIDEDYFGAGSFLSDTEYAERLRVRPFDWRHAFGDNLGDGDGGGFDVVLGNPPYGADLLERERHYLQDGYDSYEYQLNTFSFFIERALSLTRQQGLVSMIVPAVVLNQHYFRKLRQVMLSRGQLELLHHLAYKVFERAETGDTLVFVLQRSSDPASSGPVRCLTTTAESQFNESSAQLVRQSAFAENARFELNFASANALLDRLLSASVRLGDVAYCTMGIKPYQRNKGRPKQTAEDVKHRPFDSATPKDDSYKPVIVGGDITRYHIRFASDRYLRYGPWLAEPRPRAPFDRPKIVCRQTGDHIIAAYDADGRYYNLNNVYNVELTDERYDPHFVLCVLNSSLCKYVYFHLVGERGRTFAEVKKTHLVKLPLPDPERCDGEQQAELAALGLELAAVQQRYHRATAQRERQMLEAHRDRLDARIDALVCRAFGLSDAEALVIQESLA